MEQGKIKLPDNVPYSKNGIKAFDEKLLLPYVYINQVPGNSIRWELAKAFNYWLNISESKLIAIEEVIQLLHTASLLIDDVQDNSILRRGIPVAHSVYGISSTVNSANYATFIAFEKLQEFDKPQATQIYMEQLLELYRGQGMELYRRDSSICPTEEEYNEFSVGKTGGLFILAIRLMQLFSTDTRDLTKLARILALSYEILNDYTNLYFPLVFEKNSYCKDISEGKYSFPIIHAIRSRPNDKRVISILRQRTTSDDIKRYLVDLLEQFGSFEYTRKTLQGLRNDALEEVKNLGKNPLMEEFIRDFYKGCIEDHDEH